MDIFDPNVTAAVPNLVALILGAGILLGALWKIVTKVNEGAKDNTVLLVGALSTLSERHEAVQQKMSDGMFAMIKETHTFQSDLSNRTNEVIMRNTVQNAQTQVIMDKVLEKLK